MNKVNQVIKLKGAARQKYGFTGNLLTYVFTALRIAFFLLFFSSAGIYQAYAQKYSPQISSSGCLLGGEHPITLTVDNPAYGYMYDWFRIDNGAWMYTGQSTTYDSPSITVNQAGEYFCWGYSNFGEGDGGSGYEGDFDFSNVLVVANAVLPNLWADNTIICGQTGTYLHSNISNVIWYRGDGENIGSGTNYIWITTPGNYYAVGSYNCGITSPSAVITITAGYGPLPGSTIDNPIDVGTLSPENAFAHTANNADCYGNEIGRESNDIYYKFTLSSDMQVNLSHCGSSIDTYMHLLDASGNLIRELDNYGDIPCPSSLSASMTENLPAGTYYLVSEGAWAGTGNIITRISSLCSAPQAPSISADATSFNPGEGTTLHAIGEGVQWYRSGTLIGDGNDIWVTEAGKYYAYASNDCGFSPSSTILILVNSSSPSPNPVITFTKPTICPGESSIFTIQNYDPAVYTYKWYKGADSQSGTHLSGFDDQQSITVTETGKYMCYARTKLSNGLIAHWPLDGNGNDISGNGNNAALFNVSPSTDRNNNPSGALHFNGSSSYATVLDNLPLRLNNTDHTLNTWVNMFSYNQSYGSILLSKRISGYNNGWSWAVNGYTGSPGVIATPGVAGFGPGGGNINASGTRIVNLYEWHMVTVVYSLDGGEVKIYIDGVLDNVTKGLPTASAAITENLFIGKDPATGIYYFDGLMDDISIYNKSLSSSEIQQLANIPPSGSYASNIGEVTQGSLPSVPSITSGGKELLCNNENVVLVASGSGTVNWYHNGNSTGITGLTLPVSSPGTYTANATNGCGTSGFSNPIVINTRALLAPVIFADRTSICPGFSAQLTSSDGQYLEWYENGVYMRTSTSYSVNKNASIFAKQTNDWGTSPASNSIVISVIDPLTPAITIHTSVSSEVCAGTKIFFTANTVNGGKSPLYQWKVNGIDVPGATSATFSSSSLTNGQRVHAELINSTPCSGGTPVQSNTITMKINAVLTYKQSHFDLIDQKAVPSTDTAAIKSENQAMLRDLVDTACLSSADSWMARLDSGLVRNNFSSAQKEQLRAALIEICRKGGDIEHPLGSSSIKPGETTSSTYTNFRDAIKGILSLAHFTEDLNPWLIDAPFPYEIKRQGALAEIAATDSSICNTLQALKQEHAVVQPEVSFYNYLLSKYGAAMTLSPSELAMMEKACTNCKFLLEQDIILPVFFKGKGCISAAEYTAAKAAMEYEFGNNLSDTTSYYESILANYFNHRYGFELGYSDYKDFEAKILKNNTLQLCNEPPYKSLDIDPFAGLKDLLSPAVANGKRHYTSYIEEEKRKFSAEYVKYCAAAKSSASLTADQQIYHYTLYYYDQANNLVRTVPPEGVHQLADNQLQWVQEARKNSGATCGTKYDGPTAVADKSLALQQLSNTLAADTAKAIEFWLYNPDNIAGQLLATTRDNKYMLQACVKGTLINVDIYSLQQDSSNSVTFILSNHVTADVSSIAPLHSWTHLLLQGNNIKSGPLQLYVNGIQPPVLNTTASAGCGWEINGGSDPVMMPEKLSTLKHLRLYDRLLSSSEILTNASDPCFMVSPSAKPSMTAWQRFNVPPAGTVTTIAQNSTIESRYVPIYPAHSLTTSYAYNGTNQVIKQKTPDGGTSKFWYDRLSRLAISQNEKQKDEIDYSYTKYDKLGRITEVGQKRLADTLSEANYLDSTTVNTFMAKGANSQITQTLYDSIPTPGNGIRKLEQDNLRKRVAVSLYRETQNGPALQASYYTYDMAGNVKTLWQQVNGLGLKQLDYEFDLVSGKVNFVRYQQNQPDQFYYKYDYDAENRITQSWTGTMALVKPNGGSYLLDGKLDATYDYYLHGPLARMELGDQYAKVQGMDYAYTLQGWLKGVNGQKLDTQNDIGQDGKSIAKDVMSYSLGYYKGDYKPVGGSSSIAFETEYNANQGDLTGHNLYNGNISNTTVAISKFRNGDPVGYTYRYDQLNRLKEMRQHELVAGSTLWNQSSITEKYKESISYDGNGNILSYLRHGTTEGGKPLNMDNLTYNYHKDEDGILIDNQLNHVNDEISSTNYTEDIDDQPVNNYVYDKTGNLIKDMQEGINTINWTVYGKIKAISKANGMKIQYSYDPSGNRVSKTVNGVTSYYVRDAQGNNMALYDNANCFNNWKEQHLYGSSRLGIWKPNVNLNAVIDSTNSVWDSIGNKFFELNNHLGNALAVITDKRVLVNGTYEADVVSAQDYYAFGMQQPGRTFSSEDYRYGFNGKENDNEVKGEGNQQDYGFRIYDPRLGRFLSTDPLTQNYPELTPYQFASNTPIQAIDLDGLEMQRAIDGSIHVGPVNIHNINREIWRKMMDKQSMAMQKKPAVDPEKNTAQKILNTKKVKFAAVHVSGVVDDANADDNIRDASLGQKMSTSKYGHAEGKKVGLNENSAKAFLALADKYTMTVSEIAGAKHSDGSLHYQGKAYDVSYINGEHATIKNKSLKAFKKDAEALGFTVITAPAKGHNTHVHLQWGSNKKPKK